MVAGSILPVSIHKGKILFLFGKENELESRDSQGWSCFGGGTKNNETPFETALREGTEELTGFLGDVDNMKKYIENNGIYKLSHNDYHIHMIPFQYNPYLCDYYNKNHKFLWNKMDKQYLKDTELFEKIEIKWFSPTDMKSSRSEFRTFYQEILDKILFDLPNIRKFIKGNKSTSKTTRKIKSNKHNTRKSKSFIV